MPCRLHGPGKIKTCISALQEWGYNVRVGRTVGGSSVNYFSGNDDERLHDFRQMLDDDEVKAILCARGGYGTGRIIDKIDFRNFKKKPKWIIGYSDITVIHAHLYSLYYTSSIHGPMASAFNDGEYKNEYVLSLKYTLEGKKLKYQCPVHEFNRKGEAIGELIGGNLSLLTHLIGTDHLAPARGK